MKNIFSIEELNKMDMDKERKRVLDYFLTYYNRTYTYEFTLRFIFFCWYTLRYGYYEGNESYEEICLYDEQKNAKLKSIIDQRIDGISFNLITILIKHLSNDVFENFAGREDYVFDVMFASLVLGISWPFERRDMDVESEAKKLVKRAYEAMPDNPIIKREHLYNVTQAPDEQDYIRKMFPSDNMFDGHFRCWYIRDECNR